MNVQTTKHSADATTVEEALAAENYGVVDSEGATALAMQNTLLTPRFYTTDFDEMDAIDVSPVRADWDKLIDQMKSDPNKGHFKKNADWDDIDWDGMEREVEITVLDLSGRIVGQRKVRNADKVAMAVNAPVGVYMVRVRTQRGEVWKKIEVLEGKVAPSFR